jgi:GAF domain-containing protein
MVDAAERDRLQGYMKTNNIEEMVQNLVEGLLKDKPDVRPQEHWAHMLRVEKVQRENKHKAGYELKDMTAGSEVPGRLLSKLFQATRRITSEIIPKETIRIIIDETLSLLQCDRVSLFIFDKRLNMLKLNASNLDVPIRVKPGQGIAGSVFITKNTINIADCYADDRFDQTFDKMTGYRTKNLLTMPIVDFEGECLGVLQCINKKEDDEDSVAPYTSERQLHFTHIDEILLESFVQHVSVALRNADLYRAAIVTSERSTALLSMIQSLSQDLGAQSTILTITMHSNQLVQADRCTVFLVDEGKGQLCSVSTDSGKEIRIPKSKGIAGECATEGKLIVIDDCYQDSRFNKDVDKMTGYKTVSMLAVPIFRRKPRPNAGNVLAVIQMINKMEFDGEVGRFDEEDIEVMTSCTQFISSKLEGSSLLEKMSQKEVEQSEGHLAFDVLDVQSPSRTHHHQHNSLGGHAHSSTARRASRDCSIIEDIDEEEQLKPKPPPARRHSHEGSLMQFSKAQQANRRYSQKGGGNTQRRHSQDCRPVEEDNGADET